MTKKALALVLLLGIVFPLSVVAEDSLVRFEGEIGVIPVSSGGGQALTAEVVNRNIVRTSTPPAKSGGSLISRPT